MTAPYFTFSDAVQHLVDLAGSDSGNLQTRKAHRAVREAYRYIAGVANWSYYYKINRIDTHEPYSTGTITFDLTGGAAERLVTLTGGTVPTWAAGAVLQIDNQIYYIDERLSGTTFTLTSTTRPTADITTATEYTIFQDSYTLPEDYGKGSPLRNLSASYPVPEYIEPAEWHSLLITQQWTNLPRCYTVMADRLLANRLAVFFYPAPSGEYAYDQVYHRNPVPVRTEEYVTGTVTVSAGGTTVTGSGTAWTSRMEGAVMRFVDGTDPPDGLEGDHPYTDEAIIDTVASTTSLTLKSAVVSAYSADSYSISDLLDLDPGLMHTAFLRRCEYEQALLLPKDSSLQMRKAASDEALRAAMGADYRHIKDIWPMLPETPLTLRGIASEGVTNA